MLHSINWPNFIALLSLFFEKSGNIFIVIICYQSCFLNLPQHTYQGAFLREEAKKHIHQNAFIESDKANLWTLMNL